MVFFLLLEYLKISKVKSIISGSIGIAHNSKLFENSH